MDVYRNPEAGDRCHCRILDVYISKLPQAAKEKDLFYMRPFEKVKPDQSVWYYSIPVGRNRLSRMVPEMCQLANISGHKTNHSLRATGATALYEAEVPEKIIQERTGHRSLEGLRVYERTSEKQHQAVSNILSSSSQSTYLSQIKQLDCSSSTSTSNVSGVMPKMNFNGCQVNINFNQGPTAPVNFSQSMYEQQHLQLPSVENIEAFLKDID